MLDRLSTKTTVDIIRWHQYLEGYSLIAHKNKLSIAASIMSGDNSDDGFDYFKGWLIAQGKTVYQNALTNPDSLADIVCKTSDCVFEMEEIYEIAYSCYFKQKGISNPTGRDYDAFLDLVDLTQLPESQMSSLFECICFSDSMDQDLKLNEDMCDIKLLFPRLNDLFE